MPKTRPPYPAEFRAQILELAGAGRSVASLAKEFSLSTQTVRNEIAAQHQIEIELCHRLHRTRRHDEVELFDIGERSERDVRVALLQRLDSRGV